MQQQTLAESRLRRHEFNTMDELLKESRDFVQSQRFYEVCLEDEMNDRMLSTLLRVTSICWLRMIIQLISEFVVSPLNLGSFELLSWSLVPWRKLKKQQCYQQIFISMISWLSDEMSCLVIHWTVSFVSLYHISHSRITSSSSSTCLFYVVLWNSKCLLL